MGDPLMDPANGNNNREDVPPPPLGFRRVDTGYVMAGDKAWNFNQAIWQDVPATKVAVGYAVKDFFAVCRAYVPTEDEVTEFANNIADCVKMLENAEGTMHVKQSIYGPNPEGTCWVYVAISPNNHRTFFRVELDKVSALFDRLISFDLTNAEIVQDGKVVKSYVRMMGNKGGVTYCVDLYTKPEKL